MKRQGLAALGMMLAMLAFSIESAASDPDAVAIFVQGEHAKEIGDAIAAALPADWKPIDREQFAAAMTTEGQRTPIATAMAKPKSRAQLLARVRDAALATHVRSVVIAHVTRTGAKSSVSLVVIDPTRDVAPAIRRIPQTSGAPERSDLAAALAEGLPAHAAEPPPNEVPQAPPPPPSPSPVVDPPMPPRDARPEGAPVLPGRRLGFSGDLLDVAAGVTFRSRHFRYNEARTRSLAPYDVDGVPSIGAAVEIHPFGREVRSPLAGLGIVGVLQSAVGLESQGPVGARVQTSWTRFDAGLRYRLRWRGVEGGVTGQYGREAFGFSGGTPAQDLPDARYGFGRGGLDVRVPIGPIAIRAQAAYLLVLSAGGVGGRFRDASTNGVEGSLGASLPLTRLLEVRAGVTYARYLYAFSPAVGDARVAGGALDEMFGGQVALALRLD